MLMRLTDSEHLKTIIADLSRDVVIGVVSGR